MNCLFAVKKYIHYYFKSIDEYKIHSPFVFDFYTHVIKDNTLYDDYEVVSYLKDYLKKNLRKIKITDYGSGNYDLQRSISDITKKSSQWDSYAQLLYRMMRYYRFSYFIELGTSFGLTAIYLGLANPGCHGYTVDACSSSLKIAMENMQVVNVCNVDIIHNKFENALRPLLEKMPANALIYIDGNHLYEPTIQYFKTILEYQDKQPVVIIDDIYHSKEMEKAWNEMKSDKAVTISLDLYKFGILYFNQNFSQQNFILSF